MKFLITLLIDWPAQIARPFRWLAPLVARVTAGYVFLLSGWGKLNNLPKVTESFVGWGIPNADLLAPIVSAVEFGGGILLLLGLCTRIAAAPLAIIMIVAIRTALWDHVDSLETLLGLEEISYMAIFLWLAITGPGAISVDHVLQDWNRSLED
jgi:putative oxidoreductase